MYTIFLETFSKKKFCDVEIFKNVLLESVFIILLQ